MVSELIMKFVRLICDYVLDSKEVFRLCGTLSEKTADDHSVLVSNLMCVLLLKWWYINFYAYTLLGNLLYLLHHTQELIKYFKDRRNQVKPNPLAKLSLDDHQKQTRAERKVHFPSLNPPSLSLPPSLPVSLSLSPLIQIYPNSDRNLFL